MDDQTHQVGSANSQSGATYVAEYLSRKEQFIGVSKGELTDIARHGRDYAIFFGLGSVLFGSVWSLLQALNDARDGQFGWPVLLLTASTIVGLVLMLVGLYHFLRGKNAVDRLFETATTQAKEVSGHTVTS